MDGINTIGNVGLLKAEAIAFVGTRTPGAGAPTLIEEAYAKLAKPGTAIVSGLALGVDTAAHRFALDNGIPTIAFVPFGLGCSVYPPENENLFNEIKEKGLIVSPFSPDTPVAKWTFMVRNRLMAEFSNTSVLVEDRKDGGGWSEVAHAYKKGKNVFVEEKTFTLQNPLWDYEKSGVTRLLKIVRYSQGELF